MGSPSTIASDRYLMPCRTGQAPPGRMKHVKKQFLFTWELFLQQLGWLLDVGVQPHNSADSWGGKVGIAPPRPEKTGSDSFEGLVLEKCIQR